MFLINTIGELTGIRPHLNILSGILSPFFDKCAPIELELKRSVVETDTVYSIPLNSLTDFEWTEIYVISGPKFPQEVEEITGINYKKIIKDNSRQLIFTKKNEIVKEYSSFCRDFSWSRLTFGKGFHSLHNSSYVHVRKRFVADEWWLYEVVSSD